MDEGQMLEVIYDMLCVDIPQGATKKFVNKYVERHGINFTYELVTTYFADYRDNLINKRNRFARNRLPKIV